MKVKKCFFALLLAFSCFCNAQAFDFTDVMLWLPNRVIDLTDIVSVGVGFCYGGKVGARVTRAIDFNIGDGFYITARKDYNRWLSAAVEQGHSCSFLYMGTEDYQVDETWGFKMWEFPEGNSEIAHKAKLFSNTYDWWEDPFTDNYDIKKGTRDWFEISAEAGFIAYGKVAVHPIEIADFLLGIFFIDIKEDDISMSK